MFIVGLTGGIATGKSTVSEILRSFGCLIIDSDKIAREVVQPQKRAWKNIVKSFGEEILLPNGEIDREKLASIVFRDKSKRNILNRCTHPSILYSIIWQFLCNLVTGKCFVILDAPLLFESGFFVHFTTFKIVVFCDETTQLERLMKRNDLSKDEAERRIQAQMPLSEKCKRATHIIDNSGSRDRTNELVLRIYEELSSSSAYHPLRLFVFLFFGLTLCCLTWMVSWLVGKVF